jgi:hypothetical protein
MTMNKMMTKPSIALAIAGAIGFAGSMAGPASAASVPSNTVAVAAAAPSTVTDVRYYRYRHGHRIYGGAIIGGLALGAAGVVAGHRYYRDRDYDAPYGYGGSPYGYGDGPGYGYYRQRGW